MDKGLLSHPGLIIIFAIAIIVMLIIDLGIFNKKSHAIGNKEAAIWSLVWITLSMIFSGIVYYVFKADSPELAFEKVTQFQSAYWIEKALSVDNLFVFILVFGFFNVPKEIHHKVLFWGIIGALFFRAIFIFTGIGLVNLTYLDEIIYGKFSNTMYVGLTIVLSIAFFGGLYLSRQIKSIGYVVSAVAILFLALINTHKFISPDTSFSIPHINLILTGFGLFLIYAGFKSWFVSDDGDEEKDFSKSPGARVVRKLFKVSKNFDGDKFFTIENGIKLATPLLVVIGVIEFTDLLFAVDSIPAIFAIAPNDPFILYTSNIFAILGLRSLYFLLANFIHMFSKLKYGLAIILAFIGVKMVIAPFYHISSPLSLGVVGGILVLSLIISISFPDKEVALN